MQMHTRKSCQECAYLLQNPINKSNTAISDSCIVACAVRAMPMSGSLGNICREGKAL